MTYRHFLVLFLLVPIIVLALLLLRDGMGGHLKQPTYAHQSPVRPPWVVLMGLVVVAVVYTFPWDNHLISERVWWYNPALVSRVRLGQIPLEELLFFVLQTILIELWVLWLIPRAGRYTPVAEHTASATAETDANASPDNARKIGPSQLIQKHVTARVRSDSATTIRWIVVAAGALIWGIALVILLRGWRPETYLGWELVWALPPLIVQLGLGGDLLWSRRGLLLAALVPAIVYLSVADALAIQVGIWTVSPSQSLGLLLGGVLPLEELIFYIVTSALVTCGVILGVAPEMRRRLHRGLDTKLAAT